MNFAIIGATGNVGRKTLEVLEKSKLKVNKLFLIASNKSVGKKIRFKRKNITVQNIKEYDFSKADISFFAAGVKIAKKWVPRAAKKTIVIDNSKFFRMREDVPLVVPEVNAHHLRKHKNIISNPNCSTIQLVLALKGIHDKYSIRRIVVSTYQAVSGAGKSAMDELTVQTKNFLSGKKIKSKNFTKQIAFNLIPHIDAFDLDGYTKEELKMEFETKKILGKKINLTSTCVRVPVNTSHSESINVEFVKRYNFKRIKDILKKTKGCKVIDQHKNGRYITPLEAEGDYKTYISRIRRDRTNQKAINLWVVSDNLLKGAALNSVQIAETLVKNKLN